MPVYQVVPYPSYPACQWTVRLPGSTLSKLPCMSMDCPSTRWYLVQDILHVNGLSVCQVVPLHVILQVNGLSVCQVVPSPSYPVCQWTVRLPGDTLSKLSCMSMNCPSTWWYLVQAILYVNELPVYQVVPCPSYPVCQ